MGRFLIVLLSLTVIVVVLLLSSPTFDKSGSPLSTVTLRVEVPDSVDTYLPDNCEVLAVKVVPSASLKEPLILVPFKLLSAIKPILSEYSKKNLRDNSCLRHFQI